MADKQATEIAVEGIEGKKTSNLLHVDVLRLAILKLVCLVVEPELESEINGCVLNFIANYGELKSITYRKNFKILP